MQYKRLMGIDYGDKRIGIAFSDLLQIISSPHETYVSVNRQKDLEYISNLISKNDVEKVVVGLPLNMDGSEGERTKIVRKFASQLQLLTTAQIVFYDERLSSVEAEDILEEANMNWREKKKFVDKLAAQIILESYMNSRKKGE